MAVIIEPLQNVVNVLPEKAVLRKQLQMVVDVYSKYVSFLTPTIFYRYLLDLVFLLKMKSASFEKQEIKEDEMFTSHPANQEYLRSKTVSLYCLFILRRRFQMIKKVDAFLDKNSDALNQLLSKVKEGADLSGLTLEELSKKRQVGIFLARFIFLYRLHLPLLQMEKQKISIKKKVMKMN